MTSDERLRALERSLALATGARDSLLRSLRAEEDRERESSREAEVASLASDVVQAALEVRRKRLRERVETLVTRGLRSVYGREDYELTFRSTTRGGTVGLAPVLRSNFRGSPLEASIRDGHGGGVSDVVSFLLRVVILLLARPKLARVLVLDEPFRHVGALAPACATLVRELNRTLGVQFVIVTHVEDLADAADRVYRVRFSDGVTTFDREHDEAFVRGRASVREEAKAWGPETGAGGTAPSASSGAPRSTSTATTRRGRGKTPGSLPSP